MAAAHGGQVLVSLVTEELVRDALAKDLALRELGEHLLRDLSRSERIYQLVGTGLDAEVSAVALPGTLKGQRGRSSDKLRGARRGAGGRLSVA